MASRVPGGPGAQCSQAGRKRSYAGPSSRALACDDVNPGGQSFDAKFTDLVIRLIVVGLFAYFSLTLLAPFAIMVIWAVILAVALYPAFAWLRNALGGRGGLAATLITLLGLVVIVGPLGAVTVNVADTTLELVADFENQTIAVPRPPESVRDWPVIGEKVHSAWTLASTNLEAAVKRFGPPLLTAAGAIVGKIAGVGFGMLAFAVSVLIAGFLFVPGPRLGKSVKVFARRIAAERGAHFVDLAAATIRNISRGVIGVALLQALLTGLFLTPVRGSGSRPYRLSRAALLHRSGRPGAGGAAGHHLGMVDQGHRARVAPDAAADRYPGDRQRAEADPDGARTVHADARHPPRRDRRNRGLRPDRAVPGADPARDIL